MGVASTMKNPSRESGMKKPVTRTGAFNCPNCGAAVASDSVTCSYCGSPVAVRVCSSCFGAVSVKMKHCPHCGAKVASSRPKKTGLKCPRCESKLVLITVGKHSMHTCEKCGGLWLDRASFQDICTREEEQEAVLGFQGKTLKISAVPKHKPGRVYIPCPECGKLMNHKNFSHCSGVVLDWCREHGNWFDRNELQRIVAFIRNGGLRKARERELSRLKEREARLRMEEFQNAVRSNRMDSEFRGYEFRTGGIALLKALNSIFQ
jgi:Zn-finger nucleic acid-binding protein